MKFDLDQAHEAVEAAERRLAAAMLPALAVRARVQLRKALAAEQKILAAHGYDCWLSVQLRRVEALLAQPTPEDFVTEADYARTAAA